MQPVFVSDEFSRSFDRLLAYLNRQRKRFIGERLRPYGLTGAMHMFIMFLNHHPGTSQDTLCSYYYLEKCTVSKRVKQLEAQGYIYRVVDENDRRQNKLFLTEKGKDIIPVILNCLDEWSRKIADDVSEEDRQQLLSALAHMAENSNKE